MEVVVLIIHLFIAVALIGVVLLQRSEGGALGMGGGGGAGGLFSARGAANALTRTTAILVAAFFATSITLGILASSGRDASPLDAQPAAPGAPAGPANAPLTPLFPDAQPSQPAAPPAAQPTTPPAEPQPAPNP